MSDRKFSLHLLVSTDAGNQLAALPLHKGLLEHELSAEVNDILLTYAETIVDNKESLEAALRT